MAAGQFDCLLTDLSMPQLDGLTWCSSCAAMATSARPSGYLPTLPSGSTASAGGRLQYPAAQTGYLAGFAYRAAALQPGRQHAAIAGVCECSLSALFDGNQVLMKKFVCKLLESNQQDFAAAKACLPSSSGWIWRRCCTRSRAQPA
jgi:CheY-like chemotaxis protein